MTTRIVFAFILTILMITSSLNSFAYSCIQKPEEQETCSESQSRGLTSDLEKIQFMAKVNKEANNYNYVYMAIAGHGIGKKSSAGHAFIIFTKEEDIFTSQPAFQFNFNEYVRNANEKVEKESSFIVSKENALGLINYYRDNNSSVALFKVKVSPNQVKSMFREVEKERWKRKNNPVNDYSLLKNNCITNALDIINSAIDQNNEKIPSYWGKSFSIKNIFNTNALAANVPLIMIPVIKKNNSFRLVEIYKPTIVVSVEAKALVLKSYQKLAKSCSWSDDIVTQVERILSKNIMATSAKFLDYFQKISSSCQESNPEKRNYRPIQSGTGLYALYSKRERAK